MTYLEPRQILEKLREWSDTLYWNEDRNIDNSNCSDSSYYNERRMQNSVKEQERLEIIEQIKYLLDQ